MPTPVGHALGGLIVGLLAAPRAARENSSSALKSPQPPERSFVTLCAVAACLPDLDFGWGRHNMETHSIGAAILVGLAVLAWRRSTRLAIACTAAVGTHVLFDWLGSDDFPPLGVMALWPFSHEFYFADAFVFEAISRRYWLPNFVSHNVLAVVREIAILLPILGAAYYLRSGSKITKDTKGARDTKEVA